MVLMLIVPYSDAFLFGKAVCASACLATSLSCTAACTAATGGVGAPACLAGCTGAFEGCMLLCAAVPF
jgi:hypothetical protein